MNQKGQQASKQVYRQTSKQAADTYAPGKHIGRSACKEVGSQASRQACKQVRRQGSGL